MTLLDDFNEFEKCYLKESFEEENDLINKSLNIMKQINTLSLFGRNETVDELSTTSLAMLKMPYYIGELYYRRKYNQETRIQNLEYSKIYIVNYCNICNDYKLIEDKWKKLIINLIHFKNESKKDNNSMTSITRDIQVELYREQQRLKLEIRPLQESIHCKNIKLNEDDNNFEEIIRGLLLKTLYLFIYQSIDLLKNINIFLNFLHLKRNLIHLHIHLIDELTILNRSKDSTQPLSRNTLQKDGSSLKHDINQNNPLTSLNSIRLLKIDNIKNVFGLGYPSLPTVTLDEWVDQQIADGFIKLDRQPTKIKDPNHDNSSTSENEEENIDDPMILKKQRRFDDFKDNNRRGKGNTLNQG